MVLRANYNVVKIVKVLLLPEASESYHLTNTSSLGKKNSKGNKPEAKRRLKEKRGGKRKQKGKKKK